MNLKELIFGKGASSGGEGGVYRDSIQAWLPIKNIIGGVVIPRRMWSGCAASRSRRKTRIAVR